MKPIQHLQLNCTSSKTNEDLLESLALYEISYEVFVDTLMHDRISIIDFVPLELFGETLRILQIELPAKLNSVLQGEHHAIRQHAEGIEN